MVSAGPTLVDDIATSALYFGLVYYLMHRDEAPELAISFPHVRDNFYSCAKHGLGAHVTWLDEQRGQMKVLLQQHLLVQARQGLLEMGMAKEEVERYMDILEQRVITGQTGSVWQRAWMEKHHGSMVELTAAYAGNMSTGEPVHTWKI